MSLTKNNCVRCDDCGKISRHPLGEYTRPDGISAGYINAHGTETEFDYCEECWVGHCPFCASKEIVRISPMTPGPDGWASRCKACGERWSRFKAFDVLMRKLAKVSPAAVKPAKQKRRKKK